MTGMEPLTSDPLTTWAALSPHEMSVVFLVSLGSLVLAGVARGFASFLLRILGVRR